QSYTIRVWEDPGNGNPVILSNAPTRHSLNEDGYVYQLNTIDPDGDALFYRLVNAPTGSFINLDTGELVWLPENTVQGGDKVQFEVEVSDRRGGYANQSFEVEVFSQLGKINGIVWEDLNANTFRDSKLISGDSPYTLFKMDFSGSMGGFSVNWADPNLDINSLSYDNLSPVDG
ncbi:MAG: Ig-like domain-containing protein, partial [Pseudanabaena sp.]